MTPFDPEALVAMLRAFYPIVGRAALARARVERPEYFANGVLIGSSRTHLQLGDGRIFDLIFDEGGAPGHTRWQALDVTDDAGGPPDPFPLEPGPLDPIDESLELFPSGDAGFASLVAEHLAEFGDTDAQLATAATTIQEGDGSAAVDDSFGRTVEPASEAHAATIAALVADDIIGEVQASDAHVSTIDDKEPTDVEDEPGDLPEPNPGPLPI